MDTRKIFGYRNWWIKNVIYKELIEEKDYYGIDAIEVNDKLKLTQEEINIRYKLCNLVKLHTDGAVSATDIMAVLYKVEFTIADGRLKFTIDWEKNKKDKEEEKIKESIKLGLENE